MDNKVVGKRIALLRKKRGLSQEEFAKKINVVSFFTLKKRPLASSQRANFSCFSEQNMLKGNKKPVETPSFSRPTFSQTPGKMKGFL